MSIDVFQDVLDYHKAVAPHVLRATPGIPEKGVFAYYGFDFIVEELDELSRAMRSDDVVEVADALGDLQYVVNRMAMIWGIDLRPVHDEIHRANLSKVEGGILLRDDGKVLKGPHYRPPDIASVLARQQPLI